MIIHHIWSNVMNRSQLPSNLRRQFCAETPSPAVPLAAHASMNPFTPPRRGTCNRRSDEAPSWEGLGWVHEPSRSNGTGALLNRSVAAARSGGTVRLTGTALLSAATARLSLPCALELSLPRLFSLPKVKQ